MSQTIGAKDPIENALQGLLNWWKKRGDSFKRIGAIAFYIVCIVVIAIVLWAIVVICAVGISSTLGVWPLRLEWAKDHVIGFSVGLGICVVVLLLFAEFFVRRIWGLKGVIVSEDSELSLSKAQIWWWMLVIIGGFVAVFAASVITLLHHKQTITAIPSLNPDLLLVLGLGAVNVVATKAIVTNQIEQGERLDTAKPEGKASLRSLFTVSTQSKKPSLALDIYKVQLAAWTIIAITVFSVQVYRRVVDMDLLVGQELIKVCQELPASDQPKLDELLPCRLPAIDDRNSSSDTSLRRIELGRDNMADVVALPEIGAELLLLMGISQATFIGGKLITRPGKYMVVIADAEIKADNQVLATITNLNGPSQPTQVLAGWKLQLDDDLTTRKPLEFSEPPADLNIASQQARKVAFEPGSDPRGRTLKLLDATDIEIDTRKLPS